MGLDVGVVGLVRSFRSTSHDISYHQKDQFQFLQSVLAELHWRSILPTEALL